MKAKMRPVKIGETPKQKYIMNIKRASPKKTRGSKVV